MKPDEALKSAYEMAAMPARYLASLRDRLLSQQKDLKQRKKRLKKEDPFRDSARTTDNAAIDTDVNEQVGHERVEGIQNEVDKMLIRIRKALSAMRMGKYGVCTNCNKLIDTNRLAVNPTAEHCMNCAPKFESREE
jgi:RNA polymerase-binding transcription factor DksA